MKTILITLFLILSVSAFHHKVRKDDMTTYELKRAFDVQCRIKLKGTFKLTHLKNDLKDQETYENLSTEFANKQGDPEKMETYKSFSEHYALASETIKEQNESKTTYWKGVEEAQQAIVDTTQETIDAAVEAGDQPAEEDLQTLKEAQAFVDLAKESLGALTNGQDKKVDLFIEDTQNSLELPDMCKHHLSSQEMIDLGIRGHTLANMWINQYSPGMVPAEVGEDLPENAYETMAEENISYYDMPALNKQKFIAFYNQAIQAKDKIIIPCKQGKDGCEETQVLKKQMAKEDDKTKDDGSQKITAKSSAEDLHMDAETPADELELVKDDLIWSTVLYGKSSRALITWYEFWVYMCADGRPVLDSEYMVPESDERLAEMEQNAAQYAIGKLWSDKYLELNPPARLRSLRSRKAKKSLNKHHHHRRY